MRTFKLLATSLLVWTIVGCQAKNASLTNPPEKVTPVNVRGGQVAFAFNPKVDVLFVIDDSRSMEDEQKALSANIEKFVSSFAKFELIDFHIAVTRVTDLNPGSVAARKAAAAQCVGKKPTDKISTGGISIECQHVVADQAPRGELVTLKNFDTKIGKLVEYPTAPRFVTRDTPDYINVLKNTLMVGIKYVQAGGSEFEEVFHPLVGVFSNSAVQATNKGFFRPDAAVLAVFILTDADDASTYPLTKDAPARPTPNLTAQETAAFLSKFKSKGKLLTFGGLSLGTCAKDPILDQKPGEKIADGIIEFLDKTGGRSMDICSSNLGPELAKFGDMIKKEMLTKSFNLASQPQNGTLKVFYGKDEVPQRNAKGEQMWGYAAGPNGENPRVILTDALELNVQPGATLSAEYTPLVMRNIKNGRTKVIRLQE